MKVPYLLLLAFLGTLIAPSSAANATKELCHPIDKRVLLRIKQLLLNTTVNLASWDPATDCCSEWAWVRCGSTNRVNSLILSGGDSVGPALPSAIGDLPYLETLIANDNYVGPIPASLAKLLCLTFVDLSSNRLSGPIPSFFGTFPNLAKLLLSNNLLTGAIPPGLAQAPIATLELNNNKLTGPIPESFGSFKTDQVIAITLANNRLSGKIPRSLDKGNFLSLDFSGNKRLEGDASFLFSKDKTAMAFLDLSNNSFSFDMTNLSVTSRLAELFLTHNKIYGSLPEALAELPDFNFFNVSYNRLCGRIPTGALTKFDETSYPHNKCLCGTPLPPCK